MRCEHYLVLGPGPVEGEVTDQGVPVQPPGVDHHPAPQHVLIQHNVLLLLPLEHPLHGVGLQGRPANLGGGEGGDLDMWKKKKSQNK